MSQPPTDDLAPQAGEASLGLEGGDPAAPIPAVAVDFDLLVSRYESALLRYVGQLLGRGDQDVEDIVQDAFLRLHRHVHQHGDAAIQNVSTWLYRVAHNLTMDTLRKRKVRRRVQQTLADPGSGAEGDRPQPAAAGGSGHGGGDTLGDMERREACQRALSELATLPAHQKQALMLKMIEGMTIRQIAEVTQTSIGNVGYRIAQGLAELSRRLKNAGVI